MARTKRNTSVSEKVDFILNFCKPYLKDRDSNFEPIANFSDETHSQNPIKAIAEETNKSERSIQLNYKKFFRYSSKDINRYHRFLKATELIQKYFRRCKTRLVRNYRPMRLL